LITLGKKDGTSALNKLTGQFSDAEQERRFVASRKARDLQQVKLALIIAFPAILGFAALDYLVISENRTVAIALRFLWAGLGGILFISLLFMPWLQARLSFVGWAVIGVSTAVYLTLNIVTNTPDIYLSGYIIILFYILFFFPLNFVEMLAMSVVGAVVFGAVIPITRDISLGNLLTIYSQYLATLMFGIVSVYLLNRYRRGEFVAAQKIADQQQQYADLLNRILPQGVVARMQAGETRIADKFSNVAVLFADIVGFTETAARHSPEEVIRSIDGLFNCFDKLVVAHGVEKIKTIGDAYMAAAGVPEKCDRHVLEMAELALEMLEACQNCNDPDGEPIRIRIGLHVGPVIAGVIGESRFGYDLWGDTVNLASRMQGLADENSILVTEPVYRELFTNFTLIPLGRVAVKGKGEVETWQLVDREDDNNRQ
jgi:class 3 adenylate cyclase